MIKVGDEIVVSEDVNDPSVRYMGIVTRVDPVGPMGNCLVHWRASGAPMTGDLGVAAEGGIVVPAAEVHGLPAPEDVDGLERWLAE